MDEKRGLYTVEEITEAERRLVDFGPRLTGSPAHEKLISYIQSEMTAMGYEVKEDKHYFKRWEPHDYSLSYMDAGNPVVVNKEDISYYPYSGRTSGEGVTAPMKYCGSLGINTLYLGCKDKIAVISMPVFEAPCGLIFKKRAVYPQSFTPPRKQGSPVVATFAIAPLLGLARRAGAKGVICVMRGCSDDAARHQYLPFIKNYAGIPALWVTETAGKKIIESAKRGETASLKLQASVYECAPTRTLYAVLKGQNAHESILVNTHTDGVNAFEENAVIGLLSLARYFASKPLDQRRKNIVFSFVTGHFQLHQFGNALNQATTKFLDAHPELWEGGRGFMEATAGLTLEHLGCTEWRDNAEKTAFTKISDVDPELVYTSNEIMSQLYLKHLKGRKLTKTLLLRPKNLVHFGEGQPIYKKGIPSISLCPGPDYLCNCAEDGYIGKFNPEMAYEQIDTFRKVIEDIDLKSRKDLGHKQGFAWGFVF